MIFMTILKERESAVSVSASPEVSQKQPGRLRKIGKAIARHPKLVQFFTLLLLTGGTSIFLLYLLFRGAWSTHEDNLTLLRTIWLMETGGESTRIIGQNPDQNPQRVITRSYETLEPYVEADGWTWVNRFGGTITYGKQEKRLIASCGAYSPLYLICSLSEIP